MEVKVKEFLDALEENSITVEMEVHFGNSKFASESDFSVHSLEFKRENYCEFSCGSSTFECYYDDEYMELSFSEGYYYFTIKDGANEYHLCTDFGGQEFEDIIPYSVVKDEDDDLE